jgi:hypothetical protein
MRGNKKSIALHGEGMEMSPEMQVQNKTKFLAQLYACMEKYNIPFERLYNADQTGLFYKKMPNRIYLDKGNEDFHGVKQMKSKDRVTIMVCTSAEGEKLPLLIHFGDVCCIILLDYCKAHTDLDKSHLRQKLVILLSPPNCTSFMQPADKGMISRLKVGYRVLMLKKLLAICVDEELYKEAIEAGQVKQRKSKDRVTIMVCTFSAYTLWRCLLYFTS